MSQQKAAVLSGYWPLMRYNPALRNEGKNPFQLGGSFVFGPGDVDRFAQISETFGDNASMESLLGALP